MYSTLQRLNAVSALSTSAVLILLAAVSFTTFVIPHNAKADVAIKSLEVFKGRQQYHGDPRRQEFLFTKFNIDADFSSLFNWNTKQVFLSLTAEYESPKHPKNEVVVWDRIVRTKDDAHVVIPEVHNKYGFREVSKSFSNVNSTNFFLRWNVMPHVGLLTYGDAGRTGELLIPEMRSE